MFGEVFEIENAFVVELTPETKEEEKILREMKILHKNRLMVAWGDTLELRCRDEYMGYSGLKIYFNHPQREPIESIPIDS